MPEIGLKQLAGVVAGLGGAVEREAAQGAVLLCAVGALVQTHPDPEAFSAAFRRCWMQLGQPNQSQPDGSEASDGISDALAILEQLCPVRLSVRPPDQAQPPEKE